LDRSILKTGIPAAVVVSVLGFSMLFPGAVSQASSGNNGDNHGYGGQCGYGQVQDNDENDNNRDGGGGDQARRAPQSAGTSAASQSEKDREKKNHDKDCNEDEGDNGDGGGGGGGNRAAASTTLGSVVQVTPVNKLVRNPIPR
jgi:hypothetical protein